METIQVKTRKNKILISINTDQVNKEAIIGLLEQFRLEYLAEKSGLDKTILKVGEEIKDDWWAKNKKQYLKG